MDKTYAARRSALTSRRALLFPESWNPAFWKRAPTLTPPSAAPASPSSGPQPLESERWGGQGRDGRRDAAKREMQQPYWAVEQAEADAHYGLGFSVITIGERRLVGHGGSFPGQATRTLFDPKERLVVVVLVNETGGPADTLARTSATILDFALRQPRLSAERVPDGYTHYTGRFVNLWGVTDVAAFGDTLVALNPEEDDPLKWATWLAVEEEEDTLRMTRAPGYEAPGEMVRYVRDAAGRVAKVVMGGASSYPLEVYQARERGG